jgi:hypothetical protein
MVSLECAFQGAKKKVAGVANWDGRENKREKMEGADCRMSSDG